MKKHSLLAATVLIFCLLLGLTAPFLSAIVQDMQSISHRPLSGGSSHYAYQGTLINRVLALNATLNTSPAIEETDRKESSCNDAVSIWTALSEILPISGEYALLCEDFTLTPKQYSAQYHYVSLEYFGQDMTLRVILDKESALPIRIEFQCDPDVLTTFLKENSTWTLIQQYTDLLSLGEPADVYYSESTVLIGRSAPIRGTSYFAELRAMPSGGTLLLKLTAESE